MRAMRLGNIFNLIIRQATQEEEGNGEEEEEEKTNNMHTIV